MKGKNRKKLTWTVNIKQKVFYHLYKLYNVHIVQIIKHIVQIVHFVVNVSSRLIYFFYNSWRIF